MGDGTAGDGAPASSTSRRQRAAWGTGRVALLARLDAIRPELARGVPLTAIYAQHRDALGIGYASFVKLVGRYADEHRVARRRPRDGGAGGAATEAEASGLAPLPAAAAPPPAPASTRPRTFEYDPVWRPGDEERLLGPSFTKGRR
jgi:hypothetical protein